MDLKYDTYRKTDEAKDLRTQSDGDVYIAEDLKY